MNMKNYVNVIASFDTQGTVMPLKMEWEDRWLEVDRVMDVRPAASLKSGGAGIRYTCRIEGKSTYLFLEETKWFFELAN